MSMYHQGAKLNTGKIYAPPPPLPSREVLDDIHFNARNEAYRFAMANKRKSWARRWLRAEGFRP